MVFSYSNPTPRHMELQSDLPSWWLRDSASLQLWRLGPRAVSGWLELRVVLSARAVLNELVGKRRPEIRRFNLLAVAGEWWRGVSEWQGRGRRGHAARRWRGLATGRARSAERVVSYGPPWAHYLGGNQDRLLGGPLGLPDLRCTVPDGVKHKDFRGEVLG
jgi:hypothetical protein